MAKYIDAEKLKAEIERRLVKYDPDYTSAGSELKELLSFIASLQHEQDIIIIDKKDWEEQENFRKNKDFGKSLQQKQQEVCLKKELDEWMEYGPHTDYPWCSVPDAIEITAHHFYELGLNARKEE